MGIDDIVKIYLKPWINEAKEKTGTDTVNIIAHSMGGLVTRAYIQSSGYEKDIGKFAMVGTPNYGAANAYYIWEGGDPELADKLNGTMYDFLLPGNNFYSRTFSNLYKVWNSNKEFPFLLFQISESTPRTIEETKKPSPPEVRNFVQHHVPSVRQLLPTYEFLKTGTNDTKKIEDTDSINGVLDNLNKNLKFGTVTAKIFAGSNQDTISIINVGQPNALYRDGRPMGKPDEVKMGDGNVLLTSASLSNVSNFSPEKTGKHPYLIGTYINDLVEFITGII